MAIYSLHASKSQNLGSGKKTISVLAVITKAKLTSYGENLRHDQARWGATWPGGQDHPEV